MVLNHCLEYNLSFFYVNKSRTMMIKEVGAGARGREPEPQLCYLTGGVTLVEEPLRFNPSVRI